MDQFEWSVDYATGIPEIDSQHSHLFELTNRVLRGIANKNPELTLAEVLDELVQYTQSHFAFEEQCMRDAGYEHTEEHTRSHARLVGKIEDFADDLRSGKLTAQDLAEFLKNWLTLHILREDMRYLPAVTQYRGNPDADA